MQSATLLTIAVLVLILLASAGIYLLLTAESTTGLEPQEKPDSALAGSEDLPRCVMALDRSISELAQQVARLGEKMDRQAEPGKGGKRPGPAREPSGAGMVELTKAIQSLEEAVRTRPLALTSPTPLRRALEQTLNRQPQEFKSLWTTSKGATNGLLLKTYDQVLKQLGPPSKVHADSWDVLWFYPTGKVYFYDGHVCSASLEK